MKYDSPRPAAVLPPSSALFPRLLLDICSGSGERGVLSILLFHRVTRGPDPLFPEEMHAARFGELMEHVKRTFNVLPLSDAIDRLENRSLPSRALAVTFDDGYADNLTVAVPILGRYHVPATVFVASGYLDGGCMWNDIVIEACRATRERELDLAVVDLGVRPTTTVVERRKVADEVLAALKYREPGHRHDAALKVAASAGTVVPDDLMLTSEMLVELAAAGVEIGAHTRTHPILNTVADDVAWSEICGSREDLSRVIGKPISVFAYPNGKPGTDFSAVHEQMAKEAGYRAALTTAPGVASSTTDRFRLPRFTPWRTDLLGFDLMLARNMRRAIT